MIVRADHTGLGNQTWEMWRRLQPDATLVVVPTRGAGANLPQHLDRYPNAPVHHWDTRHQAISDRLVDVFADCDVVYSAETFYDQTMPERLADRGVATVLHANPELWKAEEHPTAVWLPTTWLVDHVRDRTPASIPVSVVPLPVPVDRTTVVPPDTSPKRIVHPTSTAMGDRNGGATVNKALSIWMRPGRDVIVDPVGPATRWVRNVRQVQHWWERDPGAWLSVIPRRYGGLCLPALEAMAAGVPVVMPDISPQASDWPPVIGVSAHRSAQQLMKGGLVSMYAVNPGELRGTIQRYLGPDARSEVSARTLEWAHENGPSVVMPAWWSALEAATH